MWERKLFASHHHLLKSNQLSSNLSCLSSIHVTHDRLHQIRSLVEKVVTFNVFSWSPKITRSKGFSSSFSWKDPTQTSVTMIEKNKWLLEGMCVCSSHSFVLFSFGHDFFLFSRDMIGQIKIKLSYNKTMRDLATSWEAKNAHYFSCTYYEGIITAVLLLNIVLSCDLHWQVEHGICYSCSFLFNRSPLVINIIMIIITVNVLSMENKRKSFSALSDLKNEKAKLKFKSESGNRVQKRIDQETRTNRNDFTWCCSNIE